MVEAEVTGAAATADALTAWPELVRERLRADLPEVAAQMQALAQQNVQTLTVHPTGKLASTARKAVGVGKTKVSIRVTFAQPSDDFYAPWVNFGLAPRPWHLRATHRNGGLMASRIGKAAVHKPWGIRARHFAEPTQAAMVQPFTAAVEKAIHEAAVESYRK